MSKLHDIQNALQSISAPAFQELCDSFLIRTNKNYSAFSSLGSQVGKQKTTVGTPDTFIVLKDGKYIFCEYSTNISAGVGKVKGDIEKCLDSEKTGIALDKISEIIICVNFELNTKDINELQQIIQPHYIKLTIHTIDSLALELHLHHRDLAQEYLHIPLDTGQVVSLDTFIREYNKASNSIATPLDNTFLYRKEELEEIEATLDAVDFTILTGAPGVGKTRLIIELIRKFIVKNNSYSAYCISYKHADIIQDLYQNIGLDDDVILFVDDANRIDTFSQIVGFYKTQRKGNLKIIVTVRDYALEHINKMTSDLKTNHIEISKFTDEQIIEIVKAEPYKITNGEYHNKIVHIADGNPRIALMTARVAVETQNLDALSDMSDLFDRYFETFISDDNNFNSTLNIKCLGILSFFYTLPLKNKEVLTKILSDFSISYTDFIESIEKLDKLELVDIQYDNIKIPEQNLATYFFYKAFIKDELLSFKTLLHQYFDGNIERFKDSVIPANNTFGPKRVMDKLRPTLVSYLKVVSSDKEQALVFLNTFWFYLETEAMEYLYTSIKALPTIESPKYTIQEKEKRTRSSTEIEDRHLVLLGHYINTNPDPTIPLELAFEYTQKNPEKVNALIKRVESDVMFHRNDPYLFLRQQIFFNLLEKKVNDGNQLATLIFLELAQAFTRQTYQLTQSVRNMSIQMYRMTLPLNDYVKQYRKCIWETLLTLYDAYPDKSFEILDDYVGHIHEIEVEMVKYDMPYIIEIINTKLSYNSFKDSKLVQDYIRRIEKKDIINEHLSILKETFTGSIYQLYLTLDWSKHNNIEEYEYDLGEYKKIKTAAIQNGVTLTTKEEVSRFYKAYKEIEPELKKYWSGHSSLDIVIDKHLTNNTGIGLYLLQLILEDNNVINFYPDICLKNFLTKKDNVDKIWNLLTTGNVQWVLIAFTTTPIEYLNASYLNIVFDTLDKAKEDIYIYDDALDKLISNFPKLLDKILELAITRNTTSDFKIRLRESIFSNGIDIISLSTLKTTYLQQCAIQRHFDHQKSELITLLKRDVAFLLDFTKSSNTNDTSGKFYDEVNLSMIWEVPDIEPVLAKAFDYIIEKEYYLGILKHSVNAFFKNIKEEHKKRADTFLIAYAQTNYSSTDRMNAIVDICNYTRKDLFELVLNTYITLTKDVTTFKKIKWRNGDSVYTGDVIIGDVQASEWRNILELVSKADNTPEIIPIKKYLNEEIESCLQRAQHERERKFLEKRY